MDYIEYSIKKRKKERKIKLAAAVAMIAVAILIAFSVFRSGGDVNEKTTKGVSTETGTSEEAADTTLFEDVTTTKNRTEPPSSASAAATTTSSPREENTYEYAYAGFAPAVANTDISEWWLILVNRDNILPKDYSVTLAEAAPGTGVNLDSRVAPHYAKMYKAAGEDGVTLTPLSGHRRISTQKNNFENKISYYQNKGYSKAEATQLAAMIILPPGTSEHNAGLAMDICSLDESFEKSDEFAWLCENAAEYGFILRYPKDKTDITKITYEPWHWRYVGVKDAKKIKALGVCLEEYLEMY